MKIFVLDTDIYSLFERGHPQIVARFLAIPSHELGITVITAEEKMRGRLAYIRTITSKHKSSAEQFEAYRWFRETIETIRDFSILDYTALAHTIFQSLQQQKIRIGSQDLRIAAITLSVGGILATRNQTDFGQIPDLVTEDWSK